MKHLVHSFKNRKPLHPSTLLLEIPRVLIRLEIYPKSCQLRNVLDSTIIWRPHIVAFIFPLVFDLFNSIYSVWQRIRRIIVLKRFYSAENAFTLHFTHYSSTGCEHIQINYICEHPNQQYALVLYPWFVALSCR